MRYLKDLTILALMIGAGILLRWQWSGLAERMDQLAASQQEFAQRAQEAITTPEQDGYLGRIQSFLQIYRQDLTKTQGGRVEWSDELQNKVERQLENAAIDQAEYDDKTRTLALVKAAYETLLDARWKSHMTSLGEGGTRLDIYRIHRKRDSDGSSALMADFFLWGIEPETAVTWGPTTIKYWRDGEAVAKDADAPSQEGVPTPSSDAPAPSLAGSETSEAPSMFIERPSRVYRQFPSFVAIGTLRLPEVPPAVTLMDVEIEYSVRKGDEDHATRLHWKGLPVSAEWHSSNGQTAAPTKEKEAAAAN